MQRQRHCLKGGTHCKGVHEEAWGHERGEGQTEIKAGNCNSNPKEVFLM